MPVIKTELLNINAQKQGNMGKKMNIRIDVNSNVSQIFLVEEDEARVDFRFSATYTGIGSISLEGRITYRDGGKELYEKWTETGNMPDKMAQEIHTTIMKTCMPAAVLMSREVNLPPPMPMPPVKVKGQKKKGKQSTGMEVA